jgi:hypothetical protein
VNKNDLEEYRIMKVNVTGRGAFTGIGILPVYGIDLDEKQILRLLNFQNVRVYDANNGSLITKTLLANMKAVKKPAEPKKPVVVPKKESVVVPPVVETTTTETTAFEKALLQDIVTEAQTEIEQTVEIPAVVEEEPSVAAIVPEAVEEVTDVPAIEDEAPAQPAEETERKPHNYGYKKKRNYKK